MRPLPERHQSIGHLTESNSQAVDITGQVPAVYCTAPAAAPGLVVTQQVLLQDLRGQPGQVPCHSMQGEAGYRGGMT